MTLHLIANDIRSVQNVGSLLRTSDSLGIEKIWITGYTPTPEHRKVGKTALGAEGSVEWEQQLDVLAVISKLRANGFRIVGLELDPRAKNLSEYVPSEKTALLLGNEVSGIPPSLRDACDDLVSIEQQGMKESMNVAVSAGIAAYWMLNAKSQ